MPLNEEHIRKATQGLNKPQPPTPIVIPKSHWQSYKELFNLTDEQMNKFFIASEYIDRN